MALLSFLKFAGFLVTAASSIWGLVAETSYKDEAGHKRLTASGTVSILFAITGSLVSMLSYGFQSAQDDAKRIADSSAAAARRAANAAAQVDRDRRSEAERLSDRLDADARADQAKQLQRFLAQQQQLEELAARQRQTDVITSEISKAVFPFDGATISTLADVDVLKLSDRSFVDDLVALYNSNQSDASGITFWNINGTVNWLYRPRSSLDLSGPHPAPFALALAPAIVINFELRDGSKRELSVLMGPNGPSHLAHVLIGIKGTDDERLAAFAASIPLRAVFDRYESFGDSHRA